MTLVHALMLAITVETMVWVLIPTTYTIVVAVVLLLSSAKIALLPVSQCHQGKMMYALRVEAVHLLTPGNLATTRF
jgi:hypothetical protein